MFMAPLIFLIGLTGMGIVSFGGFGLSCEGSTSLHPTAVYLTAIFTLSAAVAYGILWGKDWALKLGIVYGWMALTTCIVALFVFENYGHDYLPVEPLFLVPFIITLHRKKKAWMDYDAHPPENKTVEQAGTGQPATRPVFESEGSDQPQPEAEGRSR
jgi:hypothetical protein